MSTVTEIAPDVYRLSVYVPEINLAFNHFLVKDDEPLLYHTGLRVMFPAVKEAVARVMDPAKIRWIGFSHFESDECGSLNQWLETAPQAEPVCGALGAMVSINDFSNKPARAMQNNERLVTGKYRFRYCRTAHVPHGWDAGVMYEEKERTLFCSDLFHQWGDMEPLTESDILGRARQTLVDGQSGPFANYVPYTWETGQVLHGLADLQPTTLATMHGSSFRGNCESALRDLAVVFREVLGEPESAAGSARATGR